MRSVLYYLGGLCIVFGLMFVPVGFAVEITTVSLAGATALALGLPILISGYVIGILEDIRDAVSEEPE
jgi:hypothetical protein